MPQCGRLQRRSAQSLVPPAALASATRDEPGGQCCLRMPLARLSWFECASKCQKTRFERVWAGWRPRLVVRVPPRVLMLTEPGVELRVCLELDRS